MGLDQFDLVFKSITIILVIVAIFWYDLTGDYYQPLSYHQWNFFFIGEGFYFLFDRSKRSSFKYMYIGFSIATIFSLLLFLVEIGKYADDFGVLSNSDSDTDAHNFPSINPDIQIAASNTNSLSEQITNAYTMMFVMGIWVIIVKFIEFIWFLYIECFNSDKIYFGLFNYKTKEIEPPIENKYKWYWRLNLLAGLTIALGIIQGFMGFLWNGFIGTLLFTDITNPSAIMIFFVILVSFLGYTGKPYPEAKGGVASKINDSYNSNNTAEWLKALLEHRDRNTWDWFIPVVYLVTWSISLGALITGYNIRANQGYSSITTCSGNLTSYTYILRDDVSVSGWYKHSQVLNYYASEPSTPSSMLTYTCFNEVVEWLVIIGSFFVLGVYLYIREKRRALWQYIDLKINGKPVEPIKGNRLNKIEENEVIEWLNNLKVDVESSEQLVEATKIEIEKKPLNLTSFF